MEDKIIELETIFGEDDPVLTWIKQQLSNDKTVEQIKIDYKAFHILDYKTDN